MNQIIDKTKIIERGGILCGNEGTKKINLISECKGDRYSKPHLLLNTVLHPINIIPIRREINMTEEYIKGILDSHITNIRDNIKRFDMYNFGITMERAGVYAEAERRKDEISNDEYWSFMKEIEKLAKNANQKCECNKKVE